MAGNDTPRPWAITTQKDSEPYMSANVNPTRNSPRKLSMSEITTWIVLFGVVLTAASAHVLLKVGMDRVGMIGFEQMRDPWDVITSVFTTPALLLAGPLYGASFIGWAVVLSRFELSLAYPALAATYILIPLFAWLGLNETVTRQHWAGIFVVTIGTGMIVRAGLP
jgi:drug/metabolite transporter (DMT)-like permease